jgi:hypothetical protein
MDNMSTTTATETVEMAIVQSAPQALSMIVSGAGFTLTAEIGEDLGAIERGDALLRSFRITRSTYWRAQWDEQGDNMVAMVAEGTRNA